MKCSSLRFSVLALSLAFMHSPVALANHEHCHAKSDWVLKVSEKLDLTSEQKAKVKVIGDNAKTQATAKHTELHAIHRQMNEAYRTNTISLDKVDEFADREGHLLMDMVKIRQHERFDVYNLLDAKQKEKMNMTISNWEMKHEK